MAPIASLLLTLSLATTAELAQPSLPQGITRDGRVNDQTGAPISGAMVSLKTAGETVSSRSDDSGAFQLTGLSRASGVLTVTAAGFAPFQRQVDLRHPKALHVTLAPPPFSERLTVTASGTPTRLGDTAASVSVMSSADLSSTSAQTIDDALRQVPGFSLFRRSGSRTANPTSQGVSLRAVGASGASRATVLNDGIPLNDPFGGWIYWGRTPRLSIDRIEIVRGGGSSLYGTDAIGGVIHVIPREPGKPDVAVEASYGSENSPGGSLLASGRRGRFGALVAAEVFRTDGYVLVDERQRGIVDTRAGVGYSTLDLTVDHKLDRSGRIFVKGSLFDESRENGTPLQTNETGIRQLAGGANIYSASGGSVTLRSYVGSQVFEQAFSAVGAGRATESLTRDQRSPARHFGASGHWSKSVASRHTLVAGLEFRQVRGTSDETAFNAGRATSFVSAGGRERTAGALAQDIINVTPRFIVTVGARIDGWRNDLGLSQVTPLATHVLTATSYQPQTESAFSPRLSFLHKVNERLTLTASGYRGFRAPTLNELYRSFRVGNAVTQSNDQLRAERLTGAETGASVTAMKGRLRLRGSLFWSRLAGPIANVTLSATPELITRQRQNLGRTRSRGLDFEAQAQVSNTFSVTAGYLFADASVLDFPANVALDGLRIPQIPRHQLTFQARYANPAILTLAIQGRASGEQFDDDQNLLALKSFMILDIVVSRRLDRHFEVFSAIENLFNERYDVGRTNVTTIGSPRLARAGVRFGIGSR